jgi:predicted P-loop ATPase/GTPase
MNDQSVTSTLTERGKRYGDFRTQATLSQTLTYVWRNHYYQTHGTDPMALPPFLVEAVEMIFHKLARAANGDPLYIDTYRDIAGFAQLAVECLQDFPGATDSVVTTSGTTHAVPAYDYSAGNAPTTPN